MLCIYRIEPARNGFVVIDGQQEIVGQYETRQEAQTSIEQCQEEDAVWETATLLIENSIQTLMAMHRVDRNWARYWICSAAECTEWGGSYIK
jgi:hypothetical protein